MSGLPQIQQLLAKEKKHLIDKYSIRSLAIFGSYSKGSATELSDVDLLVDFEKPIGIQFIDLADELESLLSVKVDLVSKSGIKDKYFEAIKNDLMYV